MNGRRRLLAWPLVALTAPASLGFTPARAQTITPRILAVRLGADPARTRLVIDSGSPLGDTTTVNDPVARRLIVTFAGLVGAPSSGPGAGLVGGWSLVRGPGQNQATLTLDLAAPIQVLTAFALPPRESGAACRQVIDIVTAPPRPRIIIDAGHGGHDSGALGAITREKEVNLAAALALGRILDASGDYAVTLTRSDDRFVPLIDRQRAAQRVQGDLFLSLHADASGDATVKGASAYTLSDQGARRALNQRSLVPRPELLAMRNDDATLRDMLLDLRQRGVRNRSAAFADQLLHHVGRQTPLLRRSHREAGFMVLLGMDAPAALLEMGFITNGDDERRLIDPACQAQLMSQIATAIDAHFAAKDVVLITE